MTRPSSTERQALAELLDLVGHLLRRELCDSLTSLELRDLDMIAGKALTVAAAFTANHPSEPPLAGDDVMRLVQQRAAVQKRLRQCDDVRPARRPSHEDEPR